MCELAGEDMRLGTTLAQPLEAFFLYRLASLCPFHLVPRDKMMEESVGGSCEEERLGWRGGGSALRLEAIPVTP